MTNHTVTELDPTVSCMQDKMSQIIFDCGQQTGSNGMNLMCSTVRLVGNAHVTFLESIKLFNDLFEMCIVDVVQTDPRTYLVTRNTIGNNNDDGLNQPPLVFARERLLVRLFGFREGNSNRNHYGGNHEVQERGNIMS